MKRKISSLIIFAAAVSMMGLTACASSDQSGAAETAANSVTEAVTEALSDTAPEGRGQGEGRRMDGGTMAKVTAVDGSTITIVESAKQERGGERPTGEAPQGEPNGEMPTGEAPQGKGDKGGKPSGEAPAGEPDGEKPTGEAPDGKGGERPADGEMPEMTFDGEEKTITVDESILYTEENGEKTQAALSDIAVDTVLSITYDTDGTTPAEIIIRK